MQNTHSQSCLKSFLECHGLSLLWIWMTELGDSRGSTANNLKLQLEVSGSLNHVRFEAFIGILLITHSMSISICF